MRAFTTGLLMLLVAALARPLEQGARVGDEAPDFALKDSRGKDYRLSSYRGQKKVVLEFFRSGAW